MPQFDVYRNLDAATRHRIPYLLDVQNDLFTDLNTRLIIPLVVRSEVLQGLNPEVKIRNQSFVVSCQELCCVSVERLKEKVFSLEDIAVEIQKSLRFLFAGFEED